MPLPEVLRRLGLKYPVFQAPIGSVASPELAAAVAEAGGVGHLACTWRRLEDLPALFAEMKGLTARPYGANFALDFPIDDRLAIALECGVPLISFFFGDAANYVKRVKSAGATAIQIVGSIEGAKRAAGAGFDLIVAQGREAGGHVYGKLGTMTLVPQVVDAVKPLPVIAGGGIADRRGVAAAIALGAAGVWVGTRFLASREANIHPRYQELVLASSGDETLYSEIFDIGWPHAPLRTLKNSTTRMWEAAGRRQAPDRPREGEIIGEKDGVAVPRYSFSAPTRNTVGEVEAMALYAGENVGLVRSVAAAGEIVEELAEGFPP